MRKYKRFGFAISTAVASLLLFVVGFAVTVSAINVIENHNLPIRLEYSRVVPVNTIEQDDIQPKKVTEKREQKPAEGYAVPDVDIPQPMHGIAPVVSRIETTQKVVFLTIDDGAYRKPEVIATLKKYNLTATLFLSDAFIRPQPQFFDPLTHDGFIVENHTLSHDTLMAGKDFEYQRNEICGMTERIEKYYGRRPTLFRPPGGSYTLTTQQAAAACGMKAVVNWAAKANGGAMQYQTADERLHPGDIVLMHFRPLFVKDIEAFIKARDAAGLKVVLLEEWLTPVVN